ncbi:MAG: murein hydrolase activator EnvC family protein, partial [Nitrospiria bacterium]
MKERNVLERRRPILFSVFVCLFVLSVAVYIDPLFSQTRSELSRQIKKEKRALQKMKQVIEEKEKKRNAVKKKERSILADLEALDRRFHILQKETSLLELEIASKEKDQRQLSLQVSLIMKDIDLTSDVIARRLRTIYKEKQNAFLKVLFSAQDYPDLFRRVHYLRTVSRKEGEMLSSFKVQQIKLEKKEALLNQTKEALMLDREALAQKLISRRAEKKRKKRLFTRVRKERKFYQSVIAEMTDSSKQLQMIINQMEKERRRHDVSGTGKFSKERGRLEWPNGGKVAS